jgi:ssDNA thymidine ADP-ribosyltransferase, DarT
MDRADLHELQCIQPIANLASIAKLGILCHNEANKIEHDDISDNTIQDLRRGKRMPHAAGKGRELHEYANVYICARNPMMYVRKHLHTELVVLRLSCDVLDLEGAIVADGNASSSYTRFLTSPEGLSVIDEQITFMGDPTHPNYAEYLDRKRRQCAEVLVPDHIPSEHITGAFASCSVSLETVTALDLPWPTTIDKRMFFQ